MRSGSVLSTEQPLGGSHAHRQDSVALFFTEQEVSISFEQRNQARQRGNQSLCTRVVNRSPSQKERLLDRRTIDRLTWTQNVGGTCGNMVEQTNGIFAFISSQFDDLIQQQGFLCVRGLLVTRCNLGQDFSACGIPQRRFLMIHAGFPHLPSGSSVCFPMRWDTQGIDRTGG